MAASTQLTNKQKPSTIMNKQMTNQANKQTKK